MSFFARYFGFDKYNTTWKTEILAGMTTFLTMAYIIIVNPKILEAAGIPFGPAMAATVISAFFGTLAMGLYARRPFAIAPYMGENAFIAYTVVGVLGYNWQTALGAVFIGGVLFTLLTVLRIRSWLANAIPESMKIAFAAGIGLFLVIIGLNESGLIRMGTPGAPLHIGDWRHTTVLLALAGFLLMSALMILRFNAAVLTGILVITVASVMLGLTALPEQWIAPPPDIRPVLFQIDIAGALTWGFFAVILTVFIMDFLDTLGTLVALGMKAGLMDEKGQLPEIEKPMLCDALATVVGALCGTTTTGTYIESATGIAAGGKTGFTAVVTAFLFLIALFFEPLIRIIPPYAYAPSLILVGFLMIFPISRLNFSDLSESIPALAIIALMSFTYNIGIGMTAGFVLYPLYKILRGQWRAITPALWILAVLSLLFYIFYPY